MQINPYVQITDNETEIKLKLQFNNSNEITECGYNIKIWQTTNDMSQYMNMQNTFNEDFAYNFEKELNNNFALSYRERSVQTQAVQNVNELTLNIQDQGWILKAQNYMIFEFIPYIKVGNNTSAQTYSILQNSDTGYTLNPAVYDGNRLTNTYNVEVWSTTYWYYIQNETIEVVNIPGLMFDILSMPFAFISQAFNLVLFPGTPYQINISNLLLSIIAVLIFIAIINILIRKIR